MADSLTQAGQFEIAEVVFLQANGSAIEMSNQVDKIFLTEDMFSPFMVGKIFVRDPFDLGEVFGRSGRDLVKIRAYTPSIDQRNYIDALFFIYKIGERVQLSHRSQGYYFHIVSAEKINDLRHVSKAFTGSSDSIIRKVVTDYFETQKQLRFEASTRQLKFVSNYWKPTECIAHAADRAVDAKSNQPSMFFYENRDGFNFRSIQSIAEESPMQTFGNYDFVSRVDNTPMNAGNIVRDIQKDYSTIIEFTPYSQFDAFRSFDAGTLKSQSVAYDPIRKTYLKKSFEMGKNSSPILNANNHFRTDVITTSDPKINDVSVMFNSTDSGDSSAFSVLGKRRSLIDAMKTGIVEIEVYGRTDYTVGRKVFLDMSRDMPIRAQDPLNEITSSMFSGNYITTAVLHAFERGVGHICKIELRKESTGAL